jgi:hypothetical protein
MCEDLHIQIPICNKYWEELEIPTFRLNYFLIRKCNTFTGLKIVSQVSPSHGVLSHSSIHSLHEHGFSVFAHTCM